MPARSGSSPSGRGPSVALRSRLSRRRLAFSLFLSACALSRARLLPEGREFFAINNSFRVLIVSQKRDKCFIAQREQRLPVFPHQQNPVPLLHLRKINAAKCEPG